MKDTSNWPLSLLINSLKVFQVVFGGSPTYVSLDGLLDEWTDGKSSHREASLPINSYTINLERK